MEVLAPPEPLFPDYLAKCAFLEKKFQTKAVPLEISDRVIYTFISLKQLGDPKVGLNVKSSQKLKSFRGAVNYFN